jgi:hypothetical protein
LGNCGNLDILVSKSGWVIGLPTQLGDRNWVILEIWRFQVANRVR